MLQKRLENDHLSHHYPCASICMSTQCITLLPSTVHSITELMGSDKEVYTLHTDIKIGGGIVGTYHHETYHQSQWTGM
jgi:spore maturation protein SpmA